MSQKNILIIGGGVSGAAVLHYLKRKYARRTDVTIRLLEKNDHLGGCAATRYEDNCIFETGPNGFLDSSESTLQFIRELELEGELLRADPVARKRFLSVRNKLYPLPSGPTAFLAFKPLSLADKVRILSEVLIKKGGHPAETIAGFVSRRFGIGAARLLADPVTSGIYGGDPRQLNLKFCFPRLYDLEQEHGSLIKAMLRRGQSRSAGAGRLTSFKNGMAQLSLSIAARYKESITLNQDILAVKRVGGRFSVVIGNGQYGADEIFLCVPAYRAGELVKDMNAALGRRLQQIKYAPLVVAGLVYSREAASRFPKGFGYLVAGQEDKIVLGAVFESDLFPNRADGHRSMVRVMLGGARHPEILDMPEKEVLRLAAEDVQRTLGVQESPQRTFLKIWPKAIPQYDSDYFNLYPEIDIELKQESHFYLVGNFWGGVSMNDCIANARAVAAKSAV